MNLRPDFLLFIAFLLSFNISFAQENTNQNKFKQLGHELPTPNVYRTASGAPGHLYWQQKVDYVINVTLNDADQSISGDEEITYWNNSPDALDYLWVQLDQNVREPNSDKYKIRENAISDGMPFFEYKELNNTFPGGFQIEYVTDAYGNDLSATINKTMMRIDLPKSLMPGTKTKIKIKWSYNINDRMAIGGRSGYEYFVKDSNYLYTIAQFFPRMAVYSDNEGWQNKQFLGRGEFALPFGDYDVKITLADDLIVGATGEIQNKRAVLSNTQIERLEKARNSDSPVFIITQEEATANEKSRSSENKTWHFKAKNVRDFGFAASRKFIWDAQGIKQNNKTIMAMSLYPKEGNPLWEKYSTKAIVKTIEVYSRHTFDYPYPVAYSVNADRIGMEYPMICFNYGRTRNGKYNDRIKYGMIGVIIHEIGHNYFPMIVNSDERQWAWMDEGLNTFLQFLTESEWSDESGKPFPSRRGPAEKIINYMKGDKSKISPIMTNAESIWQLGSNSYGKPATAFNILRETVMGRELFDHAFKTYANRWKFKHPSPADFFRTMEDASAVDLDWFWRGWFYTNDHCDLSLNDVKEYRIKMNPPKEGELAAGIQPKPEIESKKKKRKLFGRKKKKNKITKETVVPKNTFDPVRQQAMYNRRNPKAAYEALLKTLSEEQLEQMNEDDYYYELNLENVGGLVMPVILEIVFEDDTKIEKRIPAEIWKQKDKVNKVIITEKKVKQIILDPKKETADISKKNNFWPENMIPEQFNIE